MQVNIYIQGSPQDFIKVPTVQFLFDILIIK